MSAPIAYGICIRCEEVLTHTCMTGGGPDAQGGQLAASGTRPDDPARQSTTERERVCECSTPVEYKGWCATCERRIRGRMPERERVPTVEELREEFLRIADEVEDCERVFAERLRAALARVAELEALQAKLLRLPETEQEVEALEADKRAERVLELLCAIRGHEVVTVKVETLREIQAELSQAKARVAEVERISTIHAEDAERFDAIVQQQEAELSRLRDGLREILDFSIVSTFDAKATYTERKEKEWRALREKTRRLLVEGE